MYLPNYFKHIGDKTFIDKYPEEVIDISKLNDGVIVELGGGVGNDMLFFVTKLGAKPENLYFVENDSEVFEKAKEKLENYFDGFMNHFLNCDALRCSLPDNFASYIYANNLLHCLGSKEKIILALKEASRVLKKNGALFGRTLSNEINETNLKRLSSQKKLSEQKKFWRDTAYWVKEGLLVGLSEEELAKYAKIAGFRNIKIKRIHPKKDSATIDFYFRISK